MKDNEKLKGLAGKINKSLIEHGINGQVGELIFMPSSNNRENLEYLKTDDDVNIRGCRLVIENGQLKWKCS